MLSSELNHFKKILDQIPQVASEYHSDLIINHALLNCQDSTRSIKEIPPLEGEKSKSGIVISAGPSVHKRNSIKTIIDSGYKGAIIAVDGSYLACLKAGLIPDFVVTLDPGPNRMVRWFGDHDFEKNSKDDDYWTRQDLDIEFRENSVKQNERHIELVNQFGHLSKAIVSSCAPRSVVQRIQEAKLDTYWWNPLVDNPNSKDSLTRQLYDINQLSCFNTGGTVGTAAWVFADAILKIPHIGVVGMDLGYYKDTPFEQTQTYYPLIEYLGSKELLEQCFMDFEFPLTKETFYTDPTYFWYRRNFLMLIKLAQGTLYNCTEGGTLVDESVECMRLNTYINKFK